MSIVDFKNASPTQRGQTIAPKTVKEELNLFRNVLNRALQYAVISKVPVSRSYYEDRQRLQESLYRRGIPAVARGVPPLVETYCYHGSCYRNAPRGDS